DHMIQSGDFGNERELIAHLEKIIRTTEEAGKLIVATGDVHHLTREDKIYREIIVNQKVPGGGRPGTFYFTFGSSESEVREDTIEGNEVSIATLTQSVDPGMCYYTIEGYATTVDQAAFGVYQQEP